MSDGPGERYAEAVAAFVTYVYESTSISDCPDETDRLSVAMSDAVSVIVKVARTRFEAAGYTPAQARIKTIDMVAYALGEDEFMESLPPTGGPS